MRALLVLSLENNALFAEGGKALAAGLKGNQVITHLNISNNDLGCNPSYGSDTSGITAIADAIPDMRAMTSLDVGMNNIPEKEMEEIMTIAASMESMKVLCEVPIKDKSLTKLDVSGKNLGTEGALVVAEYLRDNGALSMLSLKGNYLRPGGGKALAEGLKGNQAITKLNIADNRLGFHGDMSGIIVLADVIPDMGAMTSLNLASNHICWNGDMDGIKAISSAIKVLADILVPFLARSDLSFNCWYLLLSPGYEGLIIHQSPQEQNPRRPSPRACEDHAIPQEPHHPLWVEWGGD
jgi:Ran GTPase-activating protein (RanGAP) involved in mRNA processing and transport